MNTEKLKKVKLNYQTLPNPQQNNLKKKNSHQNTSYNPTLQILRIISQEITNLI